jgi:hypothetical protein
MKTSACSAMPHYYLKPLGEGERRVESPQSSAKLVQNPAEAEFPRPAKTRKLSMIARLQVISLNLTERCENDRFRSECRGAPSPYGEGVAKSCCFFLEHGNRILQQLFYGPFMDADGCQICCDQQSILLKSWRIPVTLAATMLMIQHMLKLNPDKTWPKR